MESSVAPPTELTLPQRWTLVPEGTACDGLLAIDLWVGLDSHGRIVVGNPTGGVAVGPAPEEWLGSETDWVVQELECSGADLDLLGSQQRALLRELIVELESLRPRPDPPDFRQAYLDYLEEKGAPPPRRGVVSGNRFVLGIPEEPEAVWGEGTRVLWSRGEGLMIYAPQGVGKTSVAQQLVNARIGIGPAERRGRKTTSRVPDVTRTEERVSQPMLGRAVAPAPFPCSGAGS